MEFLRKLFGSKKNEENEEVVVIENEADFMKAYNQGLFIVPKYAIIGQSNPRLRTTFNKNTKSFAKFTDDLKGKIKGVFFASSSKDKVFDLNTQTILNVQKS